MAVVRITKQGNYRIQFNKVSGQFEVLRHDTVIDTSWNVLGARQKLKKRIQEDSVNMILGREIGRYDNQRHEKGGDKLLR